VLRGEEADGFPDDLEDDDQDFAAALESWGFKGDEDTWTLQVNGENQVPSVVVTGLWSGQPVQQQL
jgi:hypothetical protein